MYGQETTGCNRRFAFLSSPMLSSFGEIADAHAPQNTPLPRFAGAHSLMHTPPALSTPPKCHSHHLTTHSLPTRPVKRPRNVPGERRIALKGYNACQRSGPKAVLGGAGSHKDCYGGQ
eukprot:jgi/Botrbrau1/10095/Bobra.20_2s0003.1